MTPPPSSVATAPSGVHRAAEATKDDSGIVDLAAASQADVGAVARAQTTPLGKQSLFDDAAPTSQPHQPAPSIPPLTPSAPPVAPLRAVVGQAATTEKKKGGGARTALLGATLVAFGAAAAGTFFYLKTQRPTEATGPVAVAPAEPKPEAAVAAPAAKPAEPQPEAALDPNALAPATPAGKAVAAKSSDSKKASAPKSGGAAKAAAAAAAEPVAEKSESLAAKLAAAEPTPPPSTSMPADLGAAIKKEVGDEPVKTPAAGTTGGAVLGNVPQKPAQGAVTGALGAVLPQARACLGPDDPISRASVVFSSNGVVQSVSVSGGAAGKPAEACIKEALSKAKLQPFAEPTYTANITIRHN